MRERERQRQREINSHQAEVKINSSHIKFFMTWIL